jgi:hypothetical protein
MFPDRIRAPGRFPEICDYDKYISLTVCHAYQQLPRADEETPYQTSHLLHFPANSANLLTTALLGDFDLAGVDAMRLKEPHQRPRNIRYATLSVSSM